ncbi:hypothetical protein ACP4OV_030415 [Aristida adscensionis]
MQHNRITMLSSSETCHLGSSSNNPAMDQQSLHPNNATVDEQILLPSSLENESYPHYLLNNHEVAMQNESLIGQQNTSLSLWDSAGSSSMGCLADHDNIFHQAKREHFAPSLSIGGPSSIDRRRHEASSSLSSHNLNIDLNVNQADQYGNEDFDMVYSNGQSRTNSVSFNRGSFTSDNFLRHEISLDAIGSSSQATNHFDHTVGQDAGVLDRQQSSSKRKNIDGSHAESSANGCSRTHQQSSILLPRPPSSSGYAASYPPMEQLNQGTNISANATSTDHYSWNHAQDESQRFMRNTRMRLSSNEYDQSLPNLLPGESFRCSAYEPTQQQSSFIPVQPRGINSSSSSQNPPHVPVVTQFSQNLHRSPTNGNLGSRIGSSSSSAETSIQRSASHDPSGTLMRRNFPEPLLLGSSLFDADSTSLLSAPGSRSNQQNLGSSSTSSNSHRAAGNGGPQQVPGLNASQPSTSVRGSIDQARRSALAASIARSSSIALQHRGPSSASQDIRSHQPASSSRSHQQHYTRAGPPTLDRQNSGYLDLQSFMQTIAASREGSRTVSELRNVVDQIRQGRSARLEDLLLIDRSIIVRRANLIDRHREMRLDVDNMSYEELLALGERIGYVNTGLSEDQIMSGMKQWKYVCIQLEESPTIVEPCCICQEDYSEGEDMGRLDCGHEFHTACIKQWLVIKNLCPICKKTALST